ncbi:cyclic nucleotide-binding domain-containing protein [Maribacter algarum]|uniref:Cyclic nucleotide-binding domain-containing protein n=1 Tax=Maribacter algarum (ex Zhang et al. 2020) TaxID=2578118 RepID=A0A5S3QI81_9FLAO|nr:cyclic nucleotide-binding domain-containing protein [Maribacter algarum]TMM57255.1 cyclic nucleotide-binding domain-containing protein [Maribacter algarum]
MNQSHFLQGIFKPENFNPEELELILRQFDEVEFGKNEYLIEKGKVANYYYFLETGFLRSYTIDTERNDITTKFFSQNDIVIDWHSYFLKKPCKESIQAVTKGKCWKISFNDFMKLFSIEAFREVGRTRLVNNYFELKNHSISVIADQAKDRYLNLIAEKPSIVQNVPLKHIATFLGITDTSLSRIRKEITL